jgi:hypothetical protein
MLIIERSKLPAYPAVARHQRRPIAAPIVFTHYPTVYGTLSGLVAPLVDLTMIRQAREELYHATDHRGFGALLRAVLEK